MSSDLTVTFEFEIGELVYVKGASHHEGMRPKQFVVFERLAQQCHGGVQMQYHLFGYDGLVPETVITRDQPPFEPKSDEQKREECRRLGGDMLRPVEDDKEGGET